MIKWQEIEQPLKPIAKHNWQAKQLADQVSVKTLKE